MACIIQGDIRFDPVAHEYMHLPTMKKLTSVSQVIRTVYSKKSWEGVDPAIIENARERGSRVDEYVSEYIRSGRIEMSDTERKDVAERVQIACRLLEKHYGNRRDSKAQHIVHDLSSGVAGSMDMAIDGTVVDLKSTYSPEVDWALQIGAYASLAGYDSGAILHVSPRFYKDNIGGRIIPYDIARCKAWWAKAVAWWETTQEMERAQKTGKIQSHSH